MSGAGIIIRVNKPAGVGVVIAGLEVIELGLGIVIVAAVADGVGVGYMGGRGDGIAVSVRHGGNFAPGVVGVFRHDAAAGVHQRHYIALEIQNVVVVRPGAAAVRGMPYRVGRAVGVVQELQPRRPEALQNELRPVVDVAVLRAVDRLARADTVGVIGIAQAAAALACRRKLPAILPAHGPAAVARRVANGVVGNRLAVVGRQQIHPVGVAVGVVDRGAIFRGGQEVARPVVGVGGDRGPGAVLHRLELAQSVVGVGVRPVALDAAHAVVGVVQLQLGYAASRIRQL